MSYVLDTDTPTRMIFLDSVNATSVMSLDANGRCYSDYVWYLSSPVMCPPHQRMVVSLVDAQMPNVFPQIVTGINDSFVYTISGVTSTLTLPSKHYTIDTLASYISANTVLAVTVDYITFKLQFSTTGVSFIISGSSTCGSIIGLTRNINGSYSNASSFANTLTMPSNFNLSGTPYVFVNVRNFTLNSLDSGDNDGIMSRVDINAPFGYTIFYRPPTIEQHLISTRMIDNIRIFLTDHNSNPLCLNSGNAQFTLRIQFITDPRLNAENQEGILDRSQYVKMKPYPIPLENYNDEIVNSLAE
jgi:hypothetical protein